MAKTQRVLSGSKTKGSTATPSGSIIYSYQGINARTTTSYFGSLLPRIGSGNRINLYKDGKPISEKYFDDESTMNNDVTDMRSLSGSVYETRIGFDLERLAFGQAPNVQLGEPFTDIAGFDPVAYVTDPGHIMWPVNLWNVGALPDHEFDGVIEPFDIRRSILGEVDLRFEGHAPRASLTGPFSENAFGSTEITEAWKKSDKPSSPFFDGPNQMARDRNRDIPVLARLQTNGKDPNAWTDPNSAQPLQGYQGLERDIMNPMVQQNYHDVVYSELLNHNPPVTFMSQSAYNLNTEWSAASYRYHGYPNLVAWFRLNESGVLANLTAQDSSPTGLTGSITGCTNFAGNLPGGFTAQTSIFDFDGAGDEVNIPGGNSGPGKRKSWDELVGGYYDNVNSINYLKSFSFSTWIRQENSSGVVLSIGAVGTNQGGGWRTIVDADGDVAVIRWGGSTGYQGIKKDTIAPDNTWVHIAFTADFTDYTESASPGSYMHIYVNGVKQTPDVLYSQSPYLRSGTVTRNAAAIGGFAEPASGTNLHGQIADVALFDRALSSEEVKAIYNATLGNPRQSVVLQDPLNTALQALNRDNLETLTNPLDKRATHGFYFGEKAGSIVYGDW